MRGEGRGGGVRGVQNPRYFDGITFIRALNNFTAILTGFHFNKFISADGKHSSNLNDIDRFEQKSAFEKKSNWPTEDSFSCAGNFRLSCINYFSPDS